VYDGERVDATRTVQLLTRRDGEMKLIAKTCLGALVRGAITATLPVALYARDPGVNQPGAAGNVGRDPGINQPGGAGNIGAAPGADPGVNQSEAAGSAGIQASTNPVRRGTSGRGPAWILGSISLALRETSDATRASISPDPPVTVPVPAARLAHAWARQRCPMDSMQIAIEYERQLHPFGKGALNRTG
jgi:hypothetical protein